MSLPALADIRIGVIGLGYVGLPLAVYLSQHFPVVGFDIDATRVDELCRGVDRTNEVTDGEFAAVKELSYTSNIEGLRGCNFYIITVPTPVDQAKRPDLSALIAASRAVAQVIAPGDIVVYESTVFPGATEEVCVPEVAKVSGLKFNQDFFAGYSPERINPGDLAHRVPDIIKVTSGSTPEVADLVNAVYAKVITAGTHRASSIRVAEAAKVIDNIHGDRKPPGIKPMSRSTELSRPDFRPPWLLGTTLRALPSPRRLGAVRFSKFSSAESQFREKPLDLV